MAVRIAGVTISLDGYMAGPDQSLEAPLGLGGQELHGWLVPTRTFRATHGGEGGEGGIDDDMARVGFEGVGATIMGRNMFGPVRGPWPDAGWTGWWGPEPPFRHDVFVLTHHARDPIPMEGGTTFHFVTDGILAALERARASAGDADVRIGGGAQTVRQYLAAGLVDQAHIVISPILLGSGERIFEDLGDLPAGYEVTGWRPSDRAAHVTLTRSAGGPG